MLCLCELIIILIPGLHSHHRTYKIRSTIFYSISPVLYNNVRFGRSFTNSKSCKWKNGLAAWDEKWRAGPGSEELNVDICSSATRGSAWCIVLFMSLWTIEKKISATQLSLVHRGQISARSTETSQHSASVYISLSDRSWPNGHARKRASHQRSQPMVVSADRCVLAGGGSPPIRTQ